MAQLLVFQRDNEIERGCKPSGAYKPGDVVAVLPDDHVFSQAEQAYPFAIVNTPADTLTTALAVMPDEQIIITRAARMVPAIRRRALTDANNRRQRRRRRYQYDGQLTRK